MTWFKVDDGFYDHPKVADLPNAAVGLWIKAGSWCSKHLTDGEIPASRVKALKGTASQVRELIECGLWSEVSADRAQSGTKSYSFRDWNDYQPTREQKREERADAAERQRESRDRKRREQEERKNVTRDSHVTPSALSQESHQRVSQRPDPTRPDPTTSPKGEVTTLPEPPVPASDATGQTKPKRTTYPQAFNAWWSAYPKHKNGSKKSAYAEWQRATKIIDATDLHRLTEAYAANPGVSSVDYCPDAHRWLRGRRWETVTETDHRVTDSHQQPRETIADWGASPQAADYFGLPWGDTPTETATYVDAEVVDITDRSIAS